MLDSTAPIDWDEPKRQRNLELRGLDFADLVSVFENRMLVWIDQRRDYRETRYVGIGVLNGREVVVVWAEHRNVRWIISCRRANAKERTRYAEAARQERSSEIAAEELRAQEPNGLAPRRRYD